MVNYFCHKWSFLLFVFSWCVIKNIAYFSCPFYLAISRHSSACEDVKDSGTKIGEMSKVLQSTMYTLVVHCCIPVSLLIGGWDWVQGGNPLYAAVKCLSDRRGQIWRIFLIFFAKSTCHIHFPGGIFFVGSKKFFYPLKWAIFWGHRHFPRIEGPFPKLRGRAVRGPLLYINLYALGST